MEWVRNVIALLLLSPFYFVSIESVYSKNLGNYHISEDYGFVLIGVFKYKLQHIKKEY